MNQPCEICGAPADEATQDLIEIPSDSEWITWEPDGEPHYRCGKHARKPKLTYLPSRSTEEVYHLEYHRNYGETLCRTSALVWMVHTKKKDI